MNKIDYMHVLNPYQPRRIYVKNEREEFPSIMAYIYYHILGPSSYKKLYTFYKNNPKNYSDLKQVFEELEISYRENIIKDALYNAYKAKILVNYNKIDEIKNSVIQTNRFDNKLIHDIIPKVCSNYQTKLTEQQKNILFKSYKIHETLIYMLAQGYDIKPFINKDNNEILQTITESHIDPLWDHKKNIFLMFYNNFPMKRSQVLLNIDSYPLIKNQKSMAYKIRRNYILKSALGMPEKKTLNYYIKQRINNEKIKEMIRIYLNEQYKEYKYTNRDMIDNEWDEYINLKYNEIEADLNLEEKKNLLENYKKIDHSEHHIKFIQELENQLISDEEEKELRVTPEINIVLEQPMEKISFESETQKNLMKELEQKQEQEEQTNKDTDLEFLNPDHNELIVIDSLVYPSISMYTYTKLLQWIEKDKLINVYPLIIQTSSKKKKIQDFKSINELEILCKQKYNERKVFYGLKVLNVLLENLLFCDQLLALDTGSIYMLMNDSLLGVDKYGNGENKLGLALQDMYKALKKRKCNKKDKFMDQLYKCSSNVNIRYWLEERYKDVIKTIKIFAYFFNIYPIDCRVTQYVINKLYLPNNEIYLTCQTENKSQPPHIFIKKIQEELQHIEYNTKVIQLIWNYVSCLCYSVIKLNKGENIEHTLEKYRSELESGDRKSKKLITRALENVACRFKNFKQDMPISYYIPSAQVIMGLSALPPIDPKTKSEREAMIKYLKNANINRLNFFAKNKCREL